MIFTAKVKLVKNNLVKDLSDIFSNQSNTIYIDDHHMSSIGNKIIAQEIANFVSESLIDPPHENQ